ITHQRGGLGAAAPSPFWHGKSLRLSQPGGNSASSATRIGKPSLIAKRKLQRSHTSLSSCKSRRVRLGLSGQRRISRKSAPINALAPRVQPEVQQVAEAPL